MSEKILRVFLQQAGNGLHPISRQILSTVRALRKDSLTQGVLFCPRLLCREELECSGLNQILIWEGDSFTGFFPEIQARKLCGLEPCEILLFPATPEGRTLSSYTAALLHTGVTADCTDLKILEDGSLLQIRPAFGGARMASILTKTRPQIASLRFSSEVPPVTGKTELIRMEKDNTVPSGRISWLDRTESADNFADLVVAVGGGIREKQDLAMFSSLAESLHGPLFCSRALVERGWMPRSAQIGLSGRSISCRTLLTFGISGSLQFCAGLQKIETLIAVDRNSEAPILETADLPIQGDLYAIGNAMLQSLQNP